MQRLAVEPLLDLSYGASKGAMIAQIDLNMLTPTGIPRATRRVKRLARAVDDAPAHCREQLSGGVPDHAQCLGQDQCLPLSVRMAESIGMKRASGNVSHRGRAGGLIITWQVKTQRYP
ncbi:hypothetical protein CQ12_18790 [Bradyrhizobium jicamae]|uniref:Uncharacterized protein n=1 Tax=Bradyrhizobium jicamae TaxID=280332 RepID=A0A0R3L2Q4_9BRAD|nr:hypothetical protein CQ12_18790 [Bradyrhizobium jicamae]